ncbi:MAG: hypothetical protein Q8P61_00270 [Candidatus Nanopelagicales bacterium]|nr:hypothetical protein [Candidatus Nanopelagicales bacterium]
MQTATRGNLRPGTGRTQAVLNDVYGWIYGDLVTAYSFGYWGGKYGNDSAQFSAKPPFAAARIAPELFAAWNIWQQAIWATSDSYGMSLGERFKAGGKKSPLIGIGSGAATMQVTLRGDCSAPQPPTSPVEGADENAQAAEESPTLLPSPAASPQPQATTKARARSCKVFIVKAGGKRKKSTQCVKGPWTPSKIKKAKLRAARSAGK